MRVQTAALGEVKGQSEWMTRVTDKWEQRERGRYSLREKKNRHSGW